MAKNKNKKICNKKAKKKKSRRPVTEVRLAPQNRNKIISELHQINKKKSLLLNNNQLSQKVKDSECKKLEEDIKALGGLNAYQFVSKTTESRYGCFNSAKWVVQQLRKHDIMHEDGKKLEMLDVGALDLNYRPHSGSIECTAIDLNPQKQGILKADLLQFKLDESCLYDVVVLSLVLNFAGDPAVRGDTLKRACQLCRHNGHLVIVLPLPCVGNSRYFTEEILVDMLQSLGFDLVSKHNSRKLAFHLFKKERNKQSNRPFPKVQQKNGAGLNNFCIILR